ncbi:MAG: hypothetical protein QM817_21650 [Archangium sp.]
MLELWSQRVVAGARQAFPMVSEPVATLSAAFVVAGRVQGAVHVPVAQADANPAAAKRLASALETAGVTETIQLKVVWCECTTGSHEGVSIDGVTLKIERLQLCDSAETIHIAQTIHAAQSLSEQSVVAASQRLESIFEHARLRSGGTQKALEQVARAAPAMELLLRTSTDILLAAGPHDETVAQLHSQLQHVSTLLREISSTSSTTLAEVSSATRKLEENASEILNALQFQDRTNQMLDDAAMQARALMVAAGVNEAPASERRLNQVGALGRTLPEDENAAVLPGGAVEFF